MSFSKAQQYAKLAILTSSAAKNISYQFQLAAIYTACSLPIQKEYYPDAIGPKLPTLPAEVNDLVNPLLAEVQKGAPPMAERLKETRFLCHASLKNTKKIESIGPYDQNLVDQYLQLMSCGEILSLLAETPQEKASAARMKKMCLIRIKQLRDHLQKGLPLVPFGTKPKSSVTPTTSSIAPSTIAPTKHSIPGSMPPTSHISPTETISPPSHIPPSDSISYPKPVIPSVSAVPQLETKKSTAPSDCWAAFAKSREVQVPKASSSTFETTISTETPVTKEDDIVEGPNVELIQSLITQAKQKVSEDNKDDLIKLMVLITRECTK
ncbi:hypothetical protein ADUPG1_010700 [Aduncisulcus paluster]|uniref:Uncharacterized protein n=1 Tax=Aduncisulcus paluster TaxID=2918883 RepID=A0ABQ5JSG9_9EUKA|nr:hypothetical protein ADUPG1_010700 [Aduncisulcus paluster]|eukprot:gnl/Carplike_NY0171/1638_a2208_1318.p1 GENE.gnl/Carplike_NY0171/1638_a2208_1318~~gnl/Carplike_NY0171/1638_a2208_1318.p1  ORF type:complete len:323 (+),score=64.30 gnl/Carplike_NY0171/1638_a2208_1318:142-1110(+)